jgi:3-methyladenine DNA glycosylase AlkC
LSVGSRRIVLIDSADFEMSSTPAIPAAPQSIKKGVALKELLNAAAVAQLAQNIAPLYRDFNPQYFCQLAMTGLEPLELMQRSDHIAQALRKALPDSYASAITILIAAMTPARHSVDTFGLAEFFYLPYSAFIARYGEDPRYNGGEDPFELSMQAMRELTQRFTAEFAIRPFLIHQPQRTLALLLSWTDDPNPHIRRLCSEGTRPKLPWGRAIPGLRASPGLAYPILQRLKADETLYVRRSVANHLGDIAKDHPQFVYSVCEAWLAEDQSESMKWLIRHALRYPAKRGDHAALRIRDLARGASRRAIGR